MLSSGFELIVCIRIIRDVVKPQLPGDSDSMGLGWGPGFCIISKLPGDADATGLCTTFVSGKTVGTEVPLYTTPKRES